MPGLAALLMPKYDEASASNIGAMAESMRHEEFYRMDFVNDGSIPVVAARVHLNLVNKPPQPIFNEDRTVFALMDGEVYGGRTLKNRLLASGHRFRTDADAELLLHLYEEKGEKLAEDLNGQFLAIIHDLARGRTLILNDFLGLYRAFYAWYDNTVLLGSEVKSILAYKGFSASVNTQGVFEQFVGGGITGDRTLFNEICRLPPASCWIYRDGQLTKKQYVDLSRLCRQGGVDDEDVGEETAKLFGSVLPRYLDGDGVGLSLTGGWDTRAIFAVLNRLGRRIPCFTWCGPYRDSLDVAIARRVAGTWGQELTVFRIGDDFFEDFDRIAQKTVYVSDGAADLYATHEMYLNRAVRDIAPIRLTGKLGTQFMSHSLTPERRRPDLRVFSKEFLDGVDSYDCQTSCDESMDSIIEGVRWFWPTGFLAAESSQLVVRSPYTDRDLLEILLPASRRLLQGSQVQKAIVKASAPELASIPSDKGDYIRPDGALARVKLASWALAAKLLTIADKAYLHRDVPHTFVRLDPIMTQTGLERLFLGSQNLVAYRRWIKNELRPFVQGLLVDERTLSREHFNRSFLQQMVSDHYAHRANYTNEIGKVMFCELWHRLFVD